MKSVTLIIVISLFSMTTSAQNLIGAWQSVSETDSGTQVKNVVILSEGFQVSTWYDLETGAFLMTNGGSWTIDGNEITEVVEFDTNNSDRVGSKVTFQIELTDNTLKIVGMDKTWSRIDDGNSGDLQGAWLMSGRVRNGETSTRDTSRPRKTMKILSGTRFQWIAYNTETKEFKGTGGGTYTTKDGKYTENIEFFSRNNKRVGASLEFDYELIEGKWHHKGFSSKGDPMHEIWGARD